MISEELLNDIFVEFDWSSPIKNFTEGQRSNLCELQADDISGKVTLESTKKYIPKCKLSFK